MITEPQITELLDITEEYPIRVVNINDGVLLSRASAKRGRIPARDNAVFEDRNLSKHHAFLQLEGDYLRIVDGGSVYGSCLFTRTDYGVINDGGFAKVDICKNPGIILGCVVKDMDTPTLTNCKLHWFIVVSQGQLIMMKLNSSKILKGTDPTVLLQSETPIRLDYTATTTTLLEKPIPQQNVIPTVLLGVITGSFLTFISLSIYGYLVRSQS